MLARTTITLCMLGAGCAAKDTPPPVEPAPVAAEPSVPVQEPEDAEDLDSFDEREEPDESQAVPAAQPEGPITFTLHNLCTKPMKYGLAAIEGETELEEPKTIKGGATQEVTAPYGIGVHLIEAGTHSAAATNTTGGHVWISASCTGVGASDDPKADPVKIDRELREKIERMKKAGEAQDAPKKPPEPDDDDDDDDDDE